MDKYPVSAIRGRGYPHRQPGRFSQTRVDVSDDALDTERTGTDLRPGTRLHAEVAQSIVSQNQSPDVPFDRSVNPYRGCEHGCVYCYARPSHSYLDLSPALDFETRIFYKRNAADLLRREFDRRNYRCKPIAIGANTDPYQPAEKKLGITRELLQVFAEYRHPVTLITKGTLIERDIDILGELAANRLCRVAISIPTLDDELKRTLEPRVPSARRRLRTIRLLSDAGISVTVLIAPVIPALTDHEIETIIRQAAAAGAQAARYILLRLPFEVAPLFREWLAQHYPRRAAHVMSLIRSASGGRDYDARFGRRQRGQGPYASMIEQRFRRACRTHRLQSDHALETDTRQFLGPEQRSPQFTFDFAAANA